MKKFNLTAGVVLLSILLFACNQTPKTTEETPIAEETIENLKAAITGESNAFLKYLFFAEEAEAQGMHNIAKMFFAASRAEEIHVENHQAVLKSLQEDEFVPVIEEAHIADSDMSKNLESAIAGETYEFMEMYPVFIETAKAENVPDAVKSFEFAMKAEKIHAEHYQMVLDILKATGNDETVSSEWYVCLVCGKLTPTIDGLSHCAICGEKVEKFKKF